ncbi:MAG: VOC family protein [Spirochaetales bacterium]|jgi:catechol 2,3-dioxygenase-like lactoylglutathione lyase family enzyme|nr:VOC family protein [Spirochaetales bacterium]
MNYSIAGIQQIGIGVENMEQAWAWYRKNFGQDVPVFKDAGEATLMADYTGGTGRQRTAVLAASMHGGGSFEVWQFTDRTPAPPLDTIRLGDLGVYAAVIRSRDINRSFNFHSGQGITLSKEVMKDPAGKGAYSVQDPYGNIFRVEESKDVFLRTRHSAGGVNGALIGVSDIGNAQKLYGDVLGYSSVLYDETGVFDDFAGIPGGESTFRRVKLSQKNQRLGGLSRFFGSSFIELVQVTDRKTVKIFRDRFWGDKGFIHICFDVYNTDALKEASEAAGFPFTVDSQDSFDMGEAQGRFAYAEDPDGTLVEMVETFKMPLVKKIGWYLDLSKRDPDRPIPGWMLKTLKFSRVKN